jgi:hypothetical protein
VVGRTERQVSGQEGYELRDILGRASEERVHIRAVSRIAAIPGFIGLVVDHARSVVPLVEAYAYQAAVSGLLLAVPGFDHGGCDEAHRVLGVSSTVEKPQACYNVFGCWEFLKAVYGHEYAGDVLSLPRYRSDMLEAGVSRWEW